MAAAPNSYHELYKNHYLHPLPQCLSVYKCLTVSVNLWLSKQLLEVFFSHLSSLVMHLHSFNDETYSKLKKNNKTTQQITWFQLPNWIAGMLMLVEF